MNCRECKFSCEGICPRMRLDCVLLTGDAQDVENAFPGGGVRHSINHRRLDALVVDSYDGHVGAMYVVPKYWWVN